MNKLPKFGSAVMGGNVPIIGRKKPDLSAIPRFTGEQLQEFLFNIAFGICEQQAHTNLRLKALESEVGFEFEAEKEEYEAEVKRLLPLVMESFGFESITEEEGSDQSEGS